jgi:hypothetical protein
VLGWAAIAEPVFVRLYKILHVSNGPFLHASLALVYVSFVQKSTK